MSTRDGIIYLGTTDGLVSFNPDSSINKSRIHTPLVTGIYLFDHEIIPGDEASPLKSSILKTDKITLGSNQNTISFDISLMTYNGKNNFQIKYRLKGLDSNWYHISADNGKISYSNLPYGKYVLQLIGIDNESLEESGLSELEIIISTPFYLSGWAITIYIILTLGIIFIAFKSYKRHNQQITERRIERTRQEQAKEMYDSKIKFFTNVAHEIRTPLTLIKAPLDYVFQSDIVKNDTEVVENLDVINLNVDRLLSLVNQLLDFRKMKNGKFQLHKQETDIGLLIRMVIERFKPTIDSSGFKLTLNIPSTEIKAIVDPEAITKILSNLLTNALKYGKSYIDIILSSTGKDFKITVSNDGNVVSPRDRENIFTMFNRSGSENIPGSGIGLSYSRSLARMHDGYLMMDDDPNKNTFVLSIPLDSASDLNADEQEDLEYLIKRNKEMSAILIVEDNEEMMNMLVKRLTPHNYRIITAIDGVAALKVLDNEYVDLIISDVMMPNMNGFELLDKVKNNVKFSHIPMILLTAKTDMRDKLEGLQLGADAYIEKPFSMEYLLANISALLRNRERLRKRLSNVAEIPKESELNEVDIEFLSSLNNTIQQNFSNPDFSMDDVFENLGMSRTSFYRKIRGLLNQTPNEYIRVFRLKKAAELFRSGHTNVTEVCYTVGFSSPSYFTKCFQKHFGINPKEYASQKH